MNAEYSYRCDHIGGVVLYRYREGTCVDDRYLQPGDDANQFLDIIENTREEGIGGIIRQYFD